MNQLVRGAGGGGAVKWVKYALEHITPDSDDSDKSAWAIEREDNSLDQSSDSGGEARRNGATTSTRGRSSGRRRVREIVMRKFLSHFQILEGKMVLSSVNLPSLRHMILFSLLFPEKKTRGYLSETN